MSEHQNYVKRMQEKFQLLQEKILLMTPSERRQYAKFMVKDVNKWIREINKCQLTYQAAIPLIKMVEDDEQTEAICQKMKESLTLRLSDLEEEKGMGLLLKKHLNQCHKQNNYDNLPELFKAHVNMMILHDSILTQASADIKTWNYHLDNIVYYPNESEEENIKSMKRLIKEQLNKKY